MKSGYNHRQEMEEARKLEAQSRNKEINEQPWQKEDDSDLWACLHVRKTHISHLNDDYTCQNYLKDVRDIKSI
ncbi:hypothetical protein [Myxosarcina sp. GI1(2024)]